VDGVARAVPAKVGKFCAVVKPVINRGLLGREIRPGQSGLAWNWRRHRGNAIQVKPVKVIQAGGHQRKCSDTAGRKIGDPEEVRGKGINGWFCLVLFVVADGRYLASRWVSPGLACEQARQDEAVAYLVDTVHGTTDEFIRAGLVISKDA
jgi:hypothetical protein